MPELPEIMHLAGQMDRELRGSLIAEVSVLQPKCLNMPPADFIAVLSGKRINGVTSKGKWIFVRLEGATFLLLNLGMGGNVVLHKTIDNVPKKYQLRLDFADGRLLTVGFWWFGYAHAVAERDLEQHQMTAGLGLSPIRDAAFDREHFTRLLDGRKGSVKNFLLHQGNIAGIGNVYIQDILFGAGIHPDRKLQTLTGADKSLLYESIMETLRQALEAGGLAYERDLYNQPGGFRDFLVGYRDGETCPVCGTVIQKIKTGSTASYVCPECQR